MFYAFFKRRRGVEDFFCPVCPVCALCGAGWLTGADGLRWIAVSPVETTLAGTNIGSSCTGPTVGWAGSAGSLPKFGLEGSREASWTSGIERKEKMRTKGAQTKNKTTPHCHLSKRQAAVTSVGEQKLHLFSSGGVPYLRGKHRYVHERRQRMRPYLYLCICSFISTLSKWH